MGCSHSTNRTWTPPSSKTPIIAYHDGDWSDTFALSEFIKGGAVDLSSVWCEAEDQVRGPEKRKNHEDLLATLVGRDIGFLKFEAHEGRLDRTSDVSLILNWVSSRFEVGDHVPIYLAARSTFNHYPSLVSMLNEHGYRTVTYVLIESTYPGEDLVSVFGCGDKEPIIPHPELNEVYDFSFEKMFEGELDRLEFMDSIDTDDSDMIDMIKTSAMSDNITFLSPAHIFVGGMTAVPPAEQRMLSSLYTRLVNSPTRSSIEAYRTRILNTVSLYASNGGVMDATVKKDLQTMVTEVSCLKVAKYQELHGLVPRLNQMHCPLLETPEVEDDELPIHIRTSLRNAYVPFVLGHKNSVGLTKCRITRDPKTFCLSSVPDEDGRVRRVQVSEKLKEKVLAYRDSVIQK